MSIQNKSMGCMFDRMISMIVVTVNSNRRMAVADFVDVLGLSKRSAQRYVKTLQEMGYLAGDGCVPQGFKATEKTKQLFRGAA